MKRAWSAAYSFIVIPLFWVTLRAIGLVNAKARRAIGDADAVRRA